MNVIRQEIRTGLLVVVVVSLAILTVGVVLACFRHKTYFVYLENARSIEKGANVTVAGRVIGRVTSIRSPVREQERPSPELEAKLEVRVDRSALIYRDVKVQVVRTSLLGEPSIDFAEGHQASGLALPGTHFTGRQIEKPPALERALDDLILAVKDSAGARAR